MAEEKKKHRTRVTVLAVLFIITAGNFMRLPHDGMRTVDFLQVLVIGMLLSALFLSSLQMLKK